MARLLGKIGFTLVEVLVVIAILGGIIGLAIPFYQSFQVGSQLDNTTHEIVQTLRRAQAHAMASDSLSAFGVHFESNQFVLFKGDSYNPTDPFNETVDLPGVLSISSGVGPDIVFSAVQGTTTDTGSVTVSTTSGQSRIITINELGIINAI